MTQNIVNTVGAVDAGFITYIFGVRDAILLALFAAVILDYIKKDIKQKAPQCTVAP